MDGSSYSVLVIGFLVSLIPTFALSRAFRWALRRMRGNPRVPMWAPHLASFLVLLAVGSSGVGGLGPAIETYLAPQLLWLLFDFGRRPLKVT